VASADAKQHMNIHMLNPSSWENHNLLLVLDIYAHTSIQARNDSWNCSIGRPFAVTFIQNHGVQPWWFFMYYFMLCWQEVHTWS